MPETGPPELQSTIRSFNRTAALVQQALKALEDQRRAIGNAALVVELSPDGRILEASPSFFELLGYARHEVIGQPCSGVQWNPPGPEQLRAQAEQLASQGVLHDYLQMRAADGRQLWLHHAMTPILGADGQPERMLCIAFDVTEQRRAEAELVEAKKLAEAASQAKSRFLSTMSHEIRTPLNGVLGMAELLSYTPLVNDQKRFVQGIQSAGKALHELLSDILDLAKVEEERLQLEVLPFEPARLVGRSGHAVPTPGAGAAQSIGGQGPGPAGFAPRRRLGSPAPGAEQSTGQRQQIYRGRDGEPVGGGPSPWNPKRRCCTIAISDTGMGMSAEALARLFQRFEQADSSTHRRFGGSGLGLVICKHIVELMGGHIQASSTEGQGSCFEFRLSLSRVVPVSASAPAAAEVRSGLRVLVAEDNLINQKVVARLLERLQATVVVVADGAQALHEVQQQPFDVVLMDCQMPEMDGFEATRRIRALGPDFVQPPIVALTANAFAEDRQACLAVGMDDFLTKPVSGERLADLLARLPTLRA